MMQEMTRELLGGQYGTKRSKMNDTEAWSVSNETQINKVLSDSTAGAG